MTEEQLEKGKTLSRLIAECSRAIYLLSQGSVARGSFNVDMSFMDESIRLKLLNVMKERYDILCEQFKKL